MRGEQVATWENFLHDSESSMCYRITFNDGNGFVKEITSGIISGKVFSDLFENGRFGVGGTVAKEARISFYDPVDDIPRACPFVIYVRMEKGSEYTSWTPLGRFFIDIRERSATNPDVISIVGYDALLLGNQPYFPANSIITGFPKLDVDVVSEICSRIGVVLDQNAETSMDAGFMIPSPNAGEKGFTLSEVLSQIGKMYGGNWYLDGNDYLCLSLVGDISEETSYLVTELGKPITLGGGRIIV